MDKNTLSEFGWIVIVVMMLAIIIPAVPLLSKIMTDGADKYVSQYLDVSKSASNKLPMPILEIDSGKLIITDPSSDAENYDIYIDYSLTETISATRPSTEYTLPTLGVGSHTIVVVSKASEKTNSNNSPITYNIPLPAPTLSIESQTLTITDSSLGAESFDVYVNYLLADTVTSSGSDTAYDLSGLGVGDYTIAVVAKASRVTNSEQATINYSVTE